MSKELGTTGVLPAAMLIGFGATLGAGASLTKGTVPRRFADLAGLPAGVVPGASLARFWRQTTLTEPSTQSPVISEVSKKNSRPPQYPVSGRDKRSLAEMEPRDIMSWDGTEQLFDLTDDWERHPS